MSALKTIRVWDAPVRVFHWLMVLCFVGAYVTAESEKLRLLHVTLGYTLGGLVVFRLLWGLVGTRYARFSSFVRGPAEVLRYLKSLRTSLPEHHLGHNPAGAVAIVLLLAAGLLVTITGWATYNDIGGEWLAQAHGWAGDAMLVVVLVHVAGVAVAIWLHRENLVRSMFTGNKMGIAAQAIRNSYPWVAAAMLMAVAYFWWSQCLWC